MGQTDDERAQATVEEHKRQAVLYKQSHKVKDAPSIASKCTQLASTYGVGIGLYFQVIAWLRYLLFWLALASVPYIIVVNTSKFTTEEYKGLAAAPGVKVLPSFNPLQAFTFAAIMDDIRDKGVLAWMNIQLPGFEGVCIMSRSLFLGWISLVDAGSMAVFSVACMVLYKTAARFVKEVDDSTMEVADYTVVIKGLPETTPIDIGKHFARYGKVMDVVMVKDFGPLLNLAHTATTLEQQRRTAEERLKSGRNAVAYQRQVKQKEKKMAKFMKEAHEQLDAGFELKAVFVTFNTQVECAKCLADLPRRWSSSWFQPRAERFLGKYRYWVEQAKPPEDYIYENLHYTRVARYIRMAVVGLVVFAMLLISAAAVTKLMAINLLAARNITWSNNAMVDKIASNMQVYPLNSTQVSLAPDLANATLQKIRATSGDLAAPLEEADAFSRLKYCSVQLRTRCSERLGSTLKTKLVLEPAERVKFVSAADTFLKADNFHKSMKDCSENDLGSCGYSMCYPCYCNLLSKMTPVMVLDAEWVYSTKQECSAYIETLNVKAATMKAVISFVIVVLNIVLKQILQVLVRFEKHWTQSDQERQYAILAFVSQLLNSVVVLLLVNARSSAASSTINASLSSNDRTSWGANLVLSGAFDDFSAAWYVDVGQSLQIIVIMNAVLTAVFAWMDWLIRKLRQSCLANCVVTASQSMYNSAWIGYDFVLDYRVSDMMLGLWIILMFGSGMPGLYIYGIVWLVVLDLTDRWYLSIMCKQPVRYGKSLPYLLLGVLPWAAATHCAFGLWMHTHFNAGNDLIVSGLADSAGSNISAWASSDIGRRITQTNGLPLLVLLIVHLTIHVIIRFLLYFFSGKAFACCCAEEDDGPEIEVTYESALLATYSKGAGKCKLAGTPTYRMPHHPRYKDFFDNAMYKPIWFKAFGRLRFTQVVSRPGGGFQISPDIILAHDETDMEDTLAGMSTDLQKMARKLADGDNADGSTKKRHSLKPRTSVGSVIDAMRDKSQSINIAVLAGINSPRASMAESSTSGDSPRLMPRASSMADPTGSFTVVSPRSGSMLAPEGIPISRQQQQSFVASPSPLSAATLGFPDMQSADSAARVPGILPGLLSHPPSFSNAASNMPGVWYPEGTMYAPATDAAMIPGMGGNMQGSFPANAGLNCYPPCNLSASFSGATQLPPGAGLNCSPPCGMPGMDGAASPEIQPMPSGPSLNCLPPYAVGLGSGYLTMGMQAGGVHISSDPMRATQLELANPPQYNFGYQAQMGAVAGAMPPAEDMPWNPLAASMQGAPAHDPIGWGIGMPASAPTGGVAGSVVPQAMWMMGPGSQVPAVPWQPCCWDGALATATANNQGSLSPYKAATGCETAQQQAPTANMLPNMQPAAAVGAYHVPLAAYSRASPGSVAEYPTIWASSQAEPALTVQNAAAGATDTVAAYPNMQARVVGLEILAMHVTPARGEHPADGAASEMAPALATGPGLSGASTADPGLAMSSAVVDVTEPTPEPTPPAPLEAATGAAQTDAASTSAAAKQEFERQLAELARDRPTPPEAPMAASAPAPTLNVTNDVSNLDASVKVLPPPAAEGPRQSTQQQQRWRRPDPVVSTAGEGQAPPATAAAAGAVVSTAAANEEHPVSSVSRPETQNIAHEVQESAAECVAAATTTIAVLGCHDDHSNNVAEEAEVHSEADASDSDDGGEPHMQAAKQQSEGTSAPGVQGSSGSGGKRRRKGKKGKRGKKH